MKNIDDFKLQQLLNENCKRQKYFLFLGEIYEFNYWHKRFVKLSLKLGCISINLSLLAINCTTYILLNDWKIYFLFWKWLQGQSGEINFFGQCQRTFSLHCCNLILNYWPINTQKLRNKTYASTISEKYDVCLKGIIYHLWIRLDSLECRK